jgi:hypothetical protein
MEMFIVSKSIVTLFSLLVIGLISVGLQNYSLQRWPFDLASEQEFVCKPINYEARIISYDPLLIHLENFISGYERRYLIELA